MSVFDILRGKMFVLMTSLLFLGGCKEVLYSQLTEADANEMVALLVLSGVPAARENDTVSGYSVLVEESDLAVAVTVLKNSGLPRERFQSLGDVFSDAGVVGTQFEERVRYTYATNQELSHTISQIVGIDSARVHVVIPAEERFGKTAEPARASIAIFHDRTFEPSTYSARIKSLAAFAVPRLEIEDISLTYFLSPGFVVKPPNQEAAVVPGGAMANIQADLTGKSIGWEFLVIVTTLVLVLVLILRTAILVWRNLKRRFDWDEGHA